MTRIITPALNDLITFTQVPTGSYASVGVEFRVTGTHHDTISIERTDTGTGTHDDVKMYRHAKWTKTN